MKQFSCQQPYLLGALVLATTSLAFAQAPLGYEVVIVSETSDFFSVPDINDHGTVTFSLETPVIGRLFVFAEGILRALTDDSVYARRPAISNSGVVAFMSRPGPSGPFSPARCNLDGSVQEIIPGLDLISGMDINDSGAITWTHDFSGNGTHAELFLYTDGKVVQVTNNGLSNQSAHINATGQIVNIAYDFSQSPDVSIVLLTSNGTSTPLTDDQVLRANTDINNSAQIVWLERLSTGTDSIRLWDKGRVTTIAEGQSSNAVSAPRISGSGHVMFGRWKDDVQEWDAWYWTPTSLQQVPDFGTSSAAGNMNAVNEGAWRASDKSGRRYVLLLRKTAPKGDFNHDCRRDLHDLAIMHRCCDGTQTDPSFSAECARADFNDDAKLDLDDMTAFLENMTGSRGSMQGCTP